MIFIGFECPQRGHSLFNDIVDIISPSCSPMGRVGAFVAGQLLYLFHPCRQARVTALQGNEAQMIEVAGCFVLFTRAQQYLQEWIGRGIGRCDARAGQPGFLGE